MKTLITNQDGLQIAVQKNELRVSHKTIADTLGILPRNALQQIKAYQNEFEELGVLLFQTEKPLNGRPEITAYLNEDQCFVLLTYSRNTDKARRAKLQLVKAFKAARDALAQRQTQYLPMYHNAHDSIKAVAAKAHANGSSTPESIYHINYEKLINKAFGLDAGMRNKLSVAQQCAITTAYALIDSAINEANMQGLDHHQAYQLAKDKLTGMAHLMNVKALGVAA